MFPYDEGHVLAFVADAVALYVQAGHPPDLPAITWLGRMQYDAVTLGYPASREKHLTALRTALGVSQGSPSLPLDGRD